MTYILPIIASHTQLPAIDNTIPSLGWVLFMCSPVIVLILFLVWFITKDMK